ncbi:hypothetical protein HDV06_001840 [Boothiomyces sp. JEL0866]|nr:hypothetical protein HDV06_001840 [Boothiomyces sp. JEL0866]
MKFACIVSLLTCALAHIHLTSIPARGLDFNSIGQEWEEGEVNAKPCGNVTTDGVHSAGPTRILVRNPTATKFNLAVENDDSNAVLWIYAGVGNNVQTFPYTILKGKSLPTASTYNFPIDLSKIPGIKVGVNASLQIVQKAQDTAPLLKYICADYTIVKK